MIMKNTPEDAFMCPSFNCYSSDSLAETAIKVAAENNNDDEEFEFAFLREGAELFPDESVPDFPVFNQNLLIEESSIAIPLSKLLIENRDEHERHNYYSSSCSSSESDELDNIPTGSYCVWLPKSVEQPSPNRCRKSKSTGSVSKGWKLSDLLRRSNSDGKDSFVFSNLKLREEKVSEKSIGAPRKGAGGAPSAHEALYVRNRAAKEGNRKKSYLPYRQNLVGFFR